MTCRWFWDRSLQVCTVIVGENCCDLLLCVVQNMLTGSIESTHVGWRCSLLTHVLCGQLAGLERLGADVDQHSTSLCAEVRIRAGFCRSSSAALLSSSDKIHFHVSLKANRHRELHAWQQCLSQQRCRDSISLFDQIRSLGFETHQPGV